MLPLNSTLAAAAADASSFPDVATSMASPEDMEYHRASAATSSALESSVRSLVDSVTVSATPFVTSTALFTAASAEATLTPGGGADYEVIDGTTIYFDGPPPPSRPPKIEPTATLEDPAAAPTAAPTQTPLSVTDAPSTVPVTISPSIEEKPNMDASTTE